MTSLKTFWSVSPKETINVAPSFKLEGTALKLVSSMSTKTSVDAGLCTEFKLREVNVAVNLGVSSDYMLSGNNYAYGIDNATSKNYFLSHSKTYLGHAKLILVESAKKVELNAPKTNISVSHACASPRSGSDTQGGCYFRLCCGCGRRCDVAGVYAEYGSGG